MDMREYEEMKKQMLADKEGGNGRFWRPGSKQEGKFPIRILPPMKKNGEKVFYFSHKTHYIDGRPYECLNQDLTDAEGNFHKSERCPVCEFVSKLYDKSERGSDDWNLAGQLKARQRYVSRIIVRNKNDNEVVVDFYEYGIKIWEKLFNIITDKEYGNILDVKSGRDFIVNKAGTGRNSDYSSSMASANVSPIFSDNEKIIAAFNQATEMSYNDLVSFVSFDEIRSALRSFLRGGEDLEIRITSPPSGTSTYEAKAINEPKQVDEEPEKDLQDDEIDSILKEFVN